MFAVHVQRGAAGDQDLKIGAMARSSATVGAACHQVLEIVQQSSIGAR